MPSCPNCSKELKDNFLTTNYPYTPEAVAYLHTFTTSTATGYCEKCAGPFLEEAHYNVVRAKDSCQKSIQQLIHNVPILSLQAPAAWTFTPITLVSGQSVTGTGAFSEFASSWTDFFGAQSDTYNKKIAGGEQLCRMQIRLKCLNLGGNAILATDIDYAEVGGDKGMLMVCMAGTAIKLENTEVLGDSVKSAIEVLQKAVAEKNALDKYASLINGPSSNMLGAVPA